MYRFEQAEAVWCANAPKEYNQLVGFYTTIWAEREEFTFALAARSYYRLYINGEMVSSGPARCAHHYCRVDERKVTLSGLCHVAIEVMALDKPEKYSNDCTMEPGMLCAEIRNADGAVVRATGREGWTCQELHYRRLLVETMSHSRGIVEYYDLEPQSMDWRTAGLTEIPVCTGEHVVYLERRAPYADGHLILMETLQSVCDILPDPEGKADAVYDIARYMNPVWYQMVPEENWFLESLCKEKEAPFSGRLMQAEENAKQIFRLMPGGNPAAVVFCTDKSELGFLEFTISVEQETVVDVINSDHLQKNGQIKANSYATRYHLSPGTYHLATFEPKLTWYVKLIFRTGGEVRCSYPVLRDYSYPDSRRAFFSCSDGELNEIYAAARRTLRLCTLDIFMDCPQRERGGWLCDSYFSGKGAWMMFGDLGVERDFIENFMLTDPEEKWKGFFPEVYPGIKQKPEDVGISNWSFWLLLELADFAKRSGDREFVERCRSRVERFVEGLLSLRGESGLLENLPEAFVDWSLSNTEYALKPVSIPNNCLAVRALEEMAGLYHMPEWEKAGGEMRRILQDIGTGSPFGGAGDGAVLENGALRRTHLRTESGIALELWSGFYGEDADYVGKFMDSMGPAPRYRQDPNIGLANLFIGLMIRFDVLAGAGEADALVKEWKSLYLPQLHMGSGTLFENSHEFSGCHGFNGAVGALMTNVVLGLGEPNQESRTVAVRPHLCGLDWAKGAACTGEGMIYMGWSADYRLHILDITLQLPPGWTAQYDFPFACSGWRILVNGKCARNEDFLSPQSTRNFNGGIEDFGGNNSTGRICCSSNRIS